MPARTSAPAGARRWERYAVVGLLFALAAAGLLAVAPAGTDTGDATTRAELQQLLDDWSAAIRGADRDALTSVIDGSSPDFLTAEVRRLESIAAIPLADLGYELAPDPAFPVPAELSARFGDDRVTAHPVLLRLAVDGIDELPTYRPVTVIFVQRPAGWRIADDAPELLGPELLGPELLGPELLGPELLGPEHMGPERMGPEYGRRGAPRTWRGPWDHGPLYTATAATSGGRSLVVGHPDRAELVDAVAADLPAAVDAVSEVWGEKWPRRALVVVTSTRAEFTHLVGTRHNGADIAAVAVSDAVYPERGIATGQRIVFNPDADRRLGDAAVRSVLRHELVHIAARADTTDGSPLWILEGYADYVGYRSGASEPTMPGGSEIRRIAPTLADVLAAGEPPTLPADDDFVDDRSRLAYETAWSIAAFTADEFGPDRLTDLYLELATGPEAADRLDEILGEVVGLDTSGFVEQWGQWLDDRL